MSGTESPWNLRRVFRLPASTKRVRREVADELHFHIEGRIEELMATGLTRSEAEHEARMRFGDFNTYRGAASMIDEQMVHERQRSDVVLALKREFSHAVHTLANNRGFTLTAILTLGLGLGAATAIFTMLDSVVLRPLPFANAERLVELTSPVPKFKGDTLWGLARHEAFYFRDNAKSIVDIGVYQTDSRTVGATGAEYPPERVRAVMTTASLFHVLSIKPELGRLILEDDNHSRTPTVVALSHDYWVRRFGARRSVIDSTIDVEGLPMTIIGVMPAAAQLPDGKADIWMAAYAFAGQPGYNNHTWGAIGLLRDGYTAKAVETELAPLTARLPEVFPDAEPARFVESTGFRTQVRALRDVVVGDSLRRALWILFGAVIVVLLIATANLSNLFLVRIEARRREMAVRAALGADRLRIAVKYLSESMMIAVAAALLALVVAQVALTTLLTLAPSTLPRLSEVHLGWPEILFAVGGALAMGVLLGMGAVFGRDPLDISILRESNRAMTLSHGRHRLRGMLVVSQIAFSLVLLSGAVLMVRSFQKLRGIETGFDPSGVFTMSVSIPDATYGRDYHRASAFFEQLASKVQAMPGVTHVGFSTRIPLSGRNLCTGVILEQPGLRGSGDCPTTAQITPGYFEAMGIPVQGQPLTWSGMDAGNGALIVSRAFASRSWAEGQAVGQGIRYYKRAEPWYRVAAVAGDVLADGSDKPPVVLVYFPVLALDSAPLWGPPTQMVLVAKTTLRRPAVLAASITKAASDIDPHAATSDPEEMEALVAQSMAGRSFTMTLLVIASCIALFLTIVGLYGTISYVVAQRRSEIAIRMALGAQVREITRMVMRQSIALAVLGILIGVLLTLGTTRVLSSLLYGVSATDPLMLVAAAIVLLLISAAASLVPSARAALVPPAEVLRSE